MPAPLTIYRIDRDGAAEVHDALGLLVRVDVDGAPARRLSPADAAALAEVGARAIAARLEGR